MANPAERAVTDETRAGDAPTSPSAADAPGAAAAPSAADTASAAATASAPKKVAPAASSTAAAASAPKKVVPPKAKAKAKSDAAANVRYTPPAPQARRAPSPRWVPILMFALWGVGLLVIILNYLGVMPGGGEDGSGWYLIAGLVSILGGIMVATQYR